MARYRRQRKLIILTVVVLLSLAGMTALLSSAAHAAPAAVFNVNSFGDATDFTINGTCETGAGNGVCTLRAAIMEANHLSGAVVNVPAGTNLLTIHPASGDPLLGGLALNGGQTLNHTLGGGSPAIDAGNPGGCLDNLGALISVDQRGAPRPSGPRCNIGALESSLVAPDAVVISGPVGGLINTLLTYTATVSPLTATQPITFVWQATGQVPVTHTAASLTDTVSFQWSTAGSQLLNVTARSAAGDAQSSYGVTIGNPLPTLSAISPTIVLAGSPAFTLTVTGANYVPSSVVRWNGSDHATTFIDAGTVETFIPASEIAARGTVPVTVFSPGPGGGESSPQSFAIWGVLYVPFVTR